MDKPTDAKPKKRGFFGLLKESLTKTSAGCGPGCGCHAEDEKEKEKEKAKNSGATKDNTKE